MKAIISHDIDHITVWEHLFKDLIVPKYMARIHIELACNKISLREYTLRWSDLFKNKWQNIDELITFNNIYQVPSSFFIAVSKGIGLNYGNVSASLWIEQMKSRGCEIGLHGIAYQNETELKSEYDLFSKITGLKDFGIRMHYVRNSSSTFEMLNKCGYKYDSTEHSFRNPYKIGKMWEFPFQIMDGWVIENKKSWQSRSLAEAKESTLRLLDKAADADLNFIGIDFHDRYFTHAFQTWLDWYMWLVDYLKSNKIDFINFDEAVKILEASEKIKSV